MIPIDSFRLVEMKWSIRCRCSAAGGGLNDYRENTARGWRSDHSKLSDGGDGLKASGGVQASRRYEGLSKSRAFRQSLSYNGLALCDLLSDNFSLFFSCSYLAMIIVLIETAERMVAAEKPDIVVHYGDLPESGRAVIAAARRKGIPVLLLQHGLYDRYSHYFNHIESDIGPDKEAAAPYCPIPTNSPCPMSTPAIY